VAHFGINNLFLLLGALSMNALAQQPDLETRLEQCRQMRISGHYLEAKQALTALLADARRKPEGTFAVRVMDSLGTTQQDLADYLGAERTLTEAIAELNRNGQKTGDLVAQVKSHLGETYLEEGRYREAKAVLRQVLEMRQNDETGDPELVAVAMLDLAMAYSHTGGDREGEALLRSSLRILEARRGPDHPMLAAALGPLSSLLARSHRYEEALATTERSWHVLSGNPKVAEPDLLNTMSALGTLYALNGRPAEGEPYAKRSVERAEFIYGPDHPRLGWYLKAYADVLKRLGRQKDARKTEQRASAILQRNEELNPVQHTVNVNALR
jgi:tetratricopeptide (TPR) repeat protein